MSRRAPDTILGLQIRNAELIEEVRQLRALLIPPGRLPTAWGLTPGEAAVVKVIARGNGAPIGVDRMLCLVYGPDHDRDRTSIHVTVCKIRHKRDRHGLSVSTHSGEGLAMPPADCARVRAALAETSTPPDMRDGMWARTRDGAETAAA